MPYIVERVNALYKDRVTGDDYADALGRWLSQREADGFKLIGIVPQHYSYGEDGLKDGNVSPMLILHRDEPV